MEEYKDMPIEELENLEEAKIELDKDVSEVNEGICKECNEKLIKIVENRSILDGAIMDNSVNCITPLSELSFRDLKNIRVFDGTQEFLRNS